MNLFKYTFLAFVMGSASLASAYDYDLYPQTSDYYRQQQLQQQTNIIYYTTGYLQGRQQANNANQEYYYTYRDEQQLRALKKQYDKNEETIARLEKKKAEREKKGLKGLRLLDRLAYNQALQERDKLQAKIDELEVKKEYAVNRPRRPTRRCYVDSWGEETCEVVYYDSRPRAPLQQEPMYYYQSGTTTTSSGDSRNTASIK